MLDSPKCSQRLGLFFCLEKIVKLTFEKLT
nr:MAG TPA: hypothetical protein [Caudoviricetes sp.]DAU31428.1 MAG TPA: hypothetical protein [Caudoviricetes sp.]